MKQAALIGSALILSALAPGWAFAAVAPGPIPVRGDSPYRHKPSGITLAANAAGFFRVKVTSFDANELNVAIDYRSADGGDFVTLYIFRNVTGGIGPWFDRARRSLEANPRVGRASLAGPVAAFAPYGQRVAGALKANYALTNSQFRSTSIALTGTPEWYVKVRASSTTRTPEQLSQIVDAAFGAVSWPRQAQLQPVTEVADCQTPLAPSGPAKPAPPDSSALLMSALGGAVSMEAKSKAQVAPAAPAIWCREPGGSPNATVYRPDGATDRYLLAINDAGIGAVVGRDELASLMSTAKTPRYSVQMMMMDRNEGLGAFASLPPATQAMQLVESGKIVFSSTTWGKGSRISIDAGSIK
ncbi:hypothetical protein SH584_11155 [Sphingomonas sp. LY29]|uniref:hypothetical protein n=1 Tax=Sphingomonas sp. LY29 TaxID=3095341 RepID=UPI002D77485D|nr:hypothetical protein [Sphingomonas sp. LY29]WRP25589.1 hypothetical protein SH584_11155 [Sphingomonas sp. LY29]